MANAQLRVLEGGLSKRPKYNEPPLTRSDVALKLNVSYGTVVRWEKDRVDPIPHTRKGSIVRFVEDDVDLWWDKYKTNKS